MPRKLQSTILYLITSGATTRATTASTEDFAHLLALVRAAVAARIDIIQLREKNLLPRVLYELTARAVHLTRDTSTKVLVNDRADIARAASADGVHLTARSLEASVVREAFGASFLIGVSAHTLAEAQAARADSANFVTFGPVFDTPSKRAYGAPVGLESLREATHTLSPFPVLALGGITLDNAPETLRAGAGGIAAIRLFSDSLSLDAAARALRNERQIVK
jgi:thiamine-phosphate pyrophosphorylase